MSEHDPDEGHCFRFAGGVVTVGGATRKIRVRGATYYFEWHHYFGPSLMTKGGRQRKALPEHHPWWSAVCWWHAQGKRIDSDGFCIWEPRYRVHWVLDIDGRNAVACNAETPGARKIQEDDFSMSAKEPAP